MTQKIDLNELKQQLKNRTDDYGIRLSTDCALSLIIAIESMREALNIAQIEAIEHPLDVINKAKETLAKFHERFER